MQQDLFGDAPKPEKKKKKKKVINSEPERINRSHVEFEEREHKTKDYEKELDGVGSKESDKMAIGSTIVKRTSSNIKLKNIIPTIIKDIHAPCEMYEIWSSKIEVLVNKNIVKLEVVYRKTEQPINNDEWLRTKVKRDLGLKKQKFDIVGIELIKKIGDVSENAGYTVIKKREYDTEKENRYKD